MNTRSKAAISSDTDNADNLRRISDRLLTFAAIIFTIAGSVAFIFLARAIDNNRMAEVGVLRVQSVANTMRSLSEDAFARGYVSMSTRHRLALCEEQNDSELRYLEPSDIDSALITNVSRAYQSAKSATDMVVRLVARGRDDSAIEVIDDRGEPAFQSLSSAVSNANTGLDKAATGAKQNASLVAESSLALILLSFGFLFRRFERRGQNHFTLSVERRMLRYNEARFHSLVENATDIIVIIDRPGNMRYISPATNRVLGIPPSSLVGSKFCNIVHHDDVEHARNIMDQAAGDNASKVSSELRLLHQDGSWRDAEIILINQLSQREVNGIIATLRDITERKQFEAQLTTTPSTMP